MLRITLSLRFRDTDVLEYSPRLFSRTMIFHDITDCFFAVEFQFRSNYDPSICFFCFPGTNVNKLEINLGWQTVTNVLRLGICPYELLYCNLYFQSPTVADTRGASRSNFFHFHPNVMGWRPRLGNRGSATDLY